MNNIENKCNDIINQQSLIIKLLTRQYGPLPQDIQTPARFIEVVPCFTELKKKLDTTVFRDFAYEYIVNPVKESYKRLESSVKKVCKSKWNK